MGGGGGGPTKGSANAGSRGGTEGGGNEEEQAVRDGVPAGETGDKNFCGKRGKKYQGEHEHFGGLRGDPKGEKSAVPCGDARCRARSARSARSARRSSKGGAGMRATCTTPRGAPKCQHDMCVTGRPPFPTQSSRPTPMRTWRTGGGAGGCSRRRPLPDGRSGTEGSPPRTAPDPPRFLPAASFPRGNGTFLSGQGRRDVEKIIIDKYTHPEIRDSLSLGERQRAFWWDTPPPSPSPARPPHPCVLLPAVRCPAPPPPMPVSRVERGGPSPPRASPPCYPDVRTHRRWLWSL